MTNEQASKQLLRDVEALKDIYWVVCYRSRVQVLLFQAFLCLLTIWKEKAMPTEGFSSVKIPKSTKIEVSYWFKTLYCRKYSIGKTYISHRWWYRNNGGYVLKESFSRYRVIIISGNFLCLQPYNNSCTCLLAMVWSRCCCLFTFGRLIWRLNLH